MPQNSFIQHISVMEDIFIQNIKSAALQEVGQALYHELQKIPCPHPCPNFPKEYMLRLFIRMRIFYVLKYANRGFQEQALMRRRTNKNRKLKILSHI